MDKVNGSVERDPYELLPEHMREGMRAYIELGRPPGDFLTAVLGNDLMEALRRADDTNFHRIGNYGRFLYNHAPAASYGSPENFNDWVRLQGLIGKERMVHHA